MSIGVIPPVLVHPYDQILLRHVRGVHEIVWGRKICLFTCVMDIGTKFVSGQCGISMVMEVVMFSYPHIPYKL